MKNFKSLFGLAIMISILFTNCSTDDDPTTDDEPISACDNYHKDLLTLSTAFDNNANAVVTYNSFLIKILALL